MALLDVSGRSPGEIEVALLSQRPSLVFNTAEGTGGPEREALYPALFEQLGLAYTGSGPHACALTLDKRATKLIAESVGVATPPFRFIGSMAEVAHAGELGLPVIVKPNFEGSSVGIDASSVVRDPARLVEVVRAALERWPAGVLVEGFVAGHDVTVPYLEGFGQRGVLSACGYDFGATRSDIYDYQLKHSGSEDVVVSCPAPLPATAREGMVRSVVRLVHALGIRDLARFDFRLDEDGTLWFLEVNALPSLEPGASMFEAAALDGLPTVERVFEAVVASASRRVGPESLNQPLKRRVGLTYNLKRVAPTRSGRRDAEAEFDTAETVQAIADAIRSHGHEVTLLEATRDLPSRLAAADVDVVFNIAEGTGGRSRESWVPALLELMGIPYTGSDPSALAVTHDKAVAKRLVAGAGVRTPRFELMRRDTDPVPYELGWPMVVKPVAEGSSKGVHAGSIVRTEAELRAQVRELTRRYEQAALVEAYLPGREFTIAVLEGRTRRMLPPMEIAHASRDEASVYSFADKLTPGGNVHYEFPTDLAPALRDALWDSAGRAFDALGCRDVARLDFRLDAGGQPCFIECNPLPGLTPGWSDLVLIADAAGITYKRLIGAILSPALARRRRSRRRRAKVSVT